MKYSIISLFFVLVYYTSFAQRREIDSLQNVLKIEQDDTGKVNTLNSLSEALWRKGIYDTSLVYSNSAQVLAEKLLFKKGVAIAFRNFGIVYWYQSKYVKALEYHNKALSINREIGNQSGIASNLSNIGTVYKELSDYPKALDFYLQALAVNKKIGSKDRIAANLGNIGIIYKVQGDFPKALDYYLEALKMAERLGDKSEVAIHCCNIGNIYTDQGDYAKALEYHLRALKLDQEMGNKGQISTDLSNIGGTYADLRDYPKSLDYNLQALKIAEEIGSIELQGACLSNLGSIYKEEGDYVKALNNFQRALKMAEEIGDKDATSTYLASIGSIYIKTGKFKEAEENLKKAIELGESLGTFNNLRQFELLLSQLYDTTGQYKLSLTYYKKAIVLKDSLFNIDKKNALMRKDLSYQFEKKEADEKAEQDIKESRQLIIRNTFIGGFGLVLIFLFLLFREYRQKQRANIIITKQKKEVEEKNKDITDSINYAKRIQRALLKEEEYVSKHLPDHFILFKPKDIVSGDFYWAIEKEEYLYFAAVDCTGHGVPGGFMSMLGMAFLNELTKTPAIQTPAEILDELRAKILKELKQTGAENETQDGMDISLMRMNLKTREIQWSGANNPLYVIDGELKETPADKQPIGYFPSMKPFTNHIVKAGKGSVVYLFSDGYADQFGGPNGKKFKHSRLKEVLLSICEKDMKEQKKILNETFENWKGHLEQVDDILVIGILV